MAFPDIDPVIFAIGPVQVRWYGLAYVVGILLGWQYARKLVANDRLWPQSGSRMTQLDIDDFLLWATVGIVAGGRIGYILFYDFAAVAANPMRALEIWNGGMSFHGGLLGTLVAMILFAPQPQHSGLQPVRRRLCGCPGRPVLRPPRQLHQFRALGQTHRCALGGGLPHRRPVPAPPHATL
jgi:prolipoprotein diacylglyceryl transferase